MARRGSSRGRGRGTPRMPVHSLNTIKAQMPDFTQSEKNNTGVARISGNLNAMFPKIRGFNAGPGGSLEQPLKNQTGYY